MSLFHWLLGKQAANDDGSDVAVVRRIADELEEMDPATARHTAAFAYLLGRVAHADLHISAVETERMEQIVIDHAGLSAAQAAMVVRIAQTHARLFGGTDDFLVTREFASVATREQKLALLECLFAVSAADHSISAQEDQEIRRVASTLRLDHRDFIAARMRHAEHLEVLKPE